MRKLLLADASGETLVVYQQYNLCICVELQVSYLGFYLKYNFNGMLFDVWCLMCDVFQKFAAVLWVLCSLTLITGGRHFHNKEQ